MKPVIRKPSEEEKQDAASWPTWAMEASQFPWEYEERETCLIMEGKVTVTNEEGEKFKFGEGDWVVFPAGMKCTWKIEKDVRKHYRFG